MFKSRQTNRLKWWDNMCNMSLSPYMRVVASTNGIIILRMRWCLTSQLSTPFSLTPSTVTHTHNRHNSNGMTLDCQRQIFPFFVVVLSFFLQIPARKNQIWNGIYLSTHFSLSLSPNTLGKAFPMNAIVVLQIDIRRSVWIVCVCVLRVVRT